MLKRLFVIILFIASTVLAEENKCIKTIAEGEAPIKKDYTSAKIEAISRAKWNAIEKALGINLSVKSVVENFKILDDVLVKDIKGFVKDTKVIDEENYEDFVKVKIQTCVYPQEAEKLIARITKNTAFTVLFLVEDEASNEFNTLTVEVIENLKTQGFTIYDLSSPPNAKSIDLAIKNKDFSSLKKVLLSNLSKVAIVGTVKFIPVSRSFQDIGYGITSGFEVVKAKVKYYILIKENGKIEILDSGEVVAKAVALTQEMAKHKALKKLSEKLTDDILEKLDKYLASQRKVITLYVDGVSSISENFKIKEEIQKLPWVKKVEDIGIGKFKVEYFENPVYLANALENILGYEVKHFSPTKIEIKLN